MPSGAKKRKAAKKKKELQPNTSNNSPHDRDDAKSLGSDGSEVCSPASQGDHSSNHHPFNDGDRSRASSAENAPRGGDEEEKLGFMDSIVGKIEQRLKSDASSSSSSSDDESKKKDNEAIPINKSNGSDISVKPVIPEAIKAVNCAEESPKTVQEPVSLPVSDYGSKASPSEFESDSKGYEGKDLPPSDVYVASPSSETVPAKGSEIREQSGNQPPVAPVQKASVFSCCGVFDLFSRSN